jgi:sugar/nucleoside kinase (ribokinase family)
MKMDIHSTAVASVGSPVIDKVAMVNEAFLETVGGEKGGMELVDAETFDRLLAVLPEAPLSSPGGSAGNTAFALARLGMNSRFVGVIGKDAPGRFYRDTFSQIGGDTGRIRVRADMPSAQCLSMVTPDGERTMRTHLGAAATLGTADIGLEVFSGCRHVHVEGYLLFNPDLMAHVLRTAKAAGCSTSVDLASFEVVSAAKTCLPDLLETFVDIVFANEEEAGAYARTKDASACLDELSDRCATVAIKCGANGAVLRERKKTYRIPAVAVDQVVDTTGAGDMWAAGFLYGLLNGCRLSRCGVYGSTLGAAVVRHEGAAIPDHEWDRLVPQLNNRSTDGR